jgi:hypothetical protein
VFIGAGKLLFNVRTSPHTAWKTFLLAENMATQEMQYLRLEPDEPSLG